MSRPSTIHRRDHRHDWRLVSAHQVSTGLVVYLRCSCGEWQIANPSPTTEPLAEIPASRPDLRLVQS